MPEVTLGEDCVNVPEMGMLFKDKKDIYEFYKKKNILMPFIFQ